MNNEPLLKSCVSVSEMANAVQLSRTRFYLLLKAGIFPPPIQVQNCRPYYDSERQKQCLDVRFKNNTGTNGCPVLFNVKTKTRKSSEPKQKISKFAYIIEALQALGVNDITDKQVESIISLKFPNGISGINEENVIRTVFIAIQST
jgi:predicted DNA-binding transcriptional regulator AlpA